MGAAAQPFSVSAIVPHDLGLHTLALSKQEGWDWGLGLGIDSESRGTYGTSNDGVSVRAQLCAVCTVWGGTCVFSLRARTSCREGERGLLLGLYTILLNTSNNTKILYYVYMLNERVNAVTLTRGNSFIRKNRDCVAQQKLTCTFIFGYVVRSK